MALKKNHKEFLKNNKSVLKSQQRFNCYEVNKITLSANDDKGIQSINSIETDTYATSKDLIYKNENIKCKNTIKQYK